VVRWTFAETPVFNWKYVETKETRVVSSMYREPNQKKKYVAAISEMNQACFFVLCDGVPLS
jgi:hypothetical protein